MSSILFIQFLIILRFHSTYQLSPVTGLRLRLFVPRVLGIGEEREKRREYVLVFYLGKKLKIFFLHFYILEVKFGPFRPSQCVGKVPNLSLVILPDLPLLCGVSCPNVPVWTSSGPSVDVDSEHVKTEETRTKGNTGRVLPTTTVTNTVSGVVTTTISILSDVERKGRRDYGMIDRGGKDHLRLSSKSPSVRSLKRSPFVTLVVKEI